MHFPACFAVGYGPVTKASQQHMSRRDVYLFEVWLWDPPICAAPRSSSWLSWKQPPVEDNGVFFSLRLEPEPSLPGEESPPHPPRTYSSAQDLCMNKDYTSPVYIRGVVPANTLLCSLLLSLKNISQTFFHVSTYTIFFLEHILFSPRNLTFLKLRDTSYLRSTAPQKVSMKWLRAS